MYTLLYKDEILFDKFYGADFGNWVQNFACSLSGCS